MKLFAFISAVALAQDANQECLDVCDQQHMENLVACNGDTECMLAANDALRECIKDCDTPAPTEPPVPDNQCHAHCDHQHEQQLAHCKPGDQHCIDKADQHYHHCINQCSCEGHCDNQHENQLSHCKPGDQHCIDKADQHYEHCLDNCASHTAPDTTTTTTEGITSTTEPVTDEPITDESTTARDPETTAVVDEETTVAEIACDYCEDTLAIDIAECKGDAGCIFGAEIDFENCFGLCLGVFNSDCENRCNTHYRNEANNNCRPNDQACFDKYRRLAAQCVKENCN